MLECIHCRNSTTQNFIRWENVFTVAIVQHNVSSFIHCKYEKSLLLRVYLHCDSLIELIELIFVKLHSNLLSSKMDANIIYI